MNSLSDKSQALRFLNGLEAGTLSSSDAYNIVKDKDPVLVYFLLRYLKDKYSASQPEAPAIMARVLELTSTYDDIKKMLRTGEKDAMREWFDDSHSIREFNRNAEGFVDLIIDKLEG